MPVWLTQRGFDVFSKSNVATRIGLSLDAELVDVLERTPLSVEIGWTTEAQGADVLFSGFETEYSAQNMHGGLKLMHRVTSFIAPHLRIAGGASSVATRFTADSASLTREFESQSWVAFGMLGAGVSVSVPTRAVVQPAFAIEGGYLLSGSAALKLEPPSDAASSSLRTVGTTLGRFERSGPYLRIGLSIRY
jgi:hypothetical protein